MRSRSGVSHSSPSVSFDQHQPVQRRLAGRHAAGGLEADLAAGAVRVVADRLEHHEADAGRRARRRPCRSRS